jgi:c-di-GMP-binding flagellar brake protein YcgR
MRVKEDDDMEIKMFKIKQKVELHIDTSTGILNLSTHIEHITDAGEFIVAAPFYKGQLYPFLAKEHVEMVCKMEHMGIISCDVVVSKRLRNGSIVLLLLEKISDIRKVQRRRHYRLPTLLETEVVPLSRQERIQLHAVTKDISAGGVKCITPERLFQQEHVRLKVDLNGESLKINSSVLESVEMSPAALRFETRFQFEKLNMDEERTIVAYIFEEQRKRRAKY